MSEVFKIRNKDGKSGSAIEHPMLHITIKTWRLVSKNHDAVQGLGSYALQCGKHVLECFIASNVLSANTMKSLCRFGTSCHNK